MLLPFMWIFSVIDKSKMDYVLYKQQVLLKHLPGMYALIRSIMSSGHGTFFTICDHLITIVVTKKPTKNVNGTAFENE